MSNAFTEWFAKATTDQRKQLATLARSSVASLRLVARGYRNPKKTPDVSADFAARIESGIQSINLEGALEGDIRAVHVTRGDLCATCSECPYLKACHAIIEMSPSDR